MLGLKKLEQIGYEIEIDQLDEITTVYYCSMSNYMLVIEIRKDITISYKKYSESNRQDEVGFISYMEHLAISELIEELRF